MDSTTESDEPVPLPRADAFDPVIEAYIKGLDQSLIRENLKKSLEERVRAAHRLQRSIDALRGKAVSPARSNGKV